jgi:hypothetical protein
MKTEKEKHYIAFSEERALEQAHGIFVKTDYKLIMNFLL